MKFKKYETLEQNTVGYKDEFGTSWKVEKEVNSNIYSVSQLIDGAYVFETKTTARSYIQACRKATEL